ncbi:type I phosphodiesterase/nucleotide pyrophosphatase [Xylanimonas cellulosilytica DSM 15894]|uniref:Type I phosphodiesterase/nucleotide pyrophosphatase n=1 Tax=Xylanimonas cellulosilytica (strain DSM 15894 / JCM 12276 / CECT 5975 / KCTC 9989 / LMG 20990 / NBRC 107835 / XIL07) TaxID=446471 RepID=D1BTH0_XYLCX|nr:nucleotide pyrophosphatase/phosphodiesterase family protein [Xylanimonas cellulosilytica]ACZ30949.1 type I phosphodiesterase/nucleotide pyrophosphatase [Xylanimonas cellulosilytica DSM 15894]
MTAVAPSDELPDGLLAPSYGTDSLAAVLPGAAGALGVPLTTATGLTSAGCANELGLPAADRVVVVLCDGLGYLNLAERAGHAPFLRGRLPQTAVLRTTFPSTTAAAMSTFGTGTAPGRTGMLGYTQRNPVTGGLANMVSWTEQSDPERVSRPGGQQLAGILPVPAHELQREPTVFERLTAAGVRVTSVGPSRFAGSGMTLAALRGAQYTAAEKLGERVDGVVRALRAPGLAYLYWGDVDKVGHHHGWQSWQWGDALEAFDLELARLVRSVPAGTLVLVTADHGQVQVDLADRFDVAHTPALAEGVTLVGGEPRALHLYADDAAAVAARWRDVLGERAVVALRADAVDRGWLGPVAEHVLPWVGDVVVAPRGRLTIVDSRTQTPPSLGLLGVHGSFTPEEMAIPLVAVTA